MESPQRASTFVDVLFEGTYVEKPKGHQRELTHFLGSRVLDLVRNMDGAHEIRLVSKVPVLVLGRLKSKKQQKTNNLSSPEHLKGSRHHPASTPRP